MAMVTLGDGKLMYEDVTGWPNVPAELAFRECPGVAVDGNDNVYLFVRGGKQPVLVFNPEGNLINAWGEGKFTDARTHGLSVSPDGHLWCVDDGLSVAQKYTLDGKLVMTLGNLNSPAQKWGGAPFNRPTHAAVSPTTGEIYVTDGYGNSRVHRFAPDGRHILSWGEAGCDPGQFQRPHNVVVDRDEYVYVADRENNRMQVFDNNGKVQAVWHDVYRPDGICMDADGLIYIGELNGQAGLEDCPRLGHRISVYNKKGERVARFGDPEDGDGPGQFVAPHGAAVDSKGNLYIGEVSYTMKGSRMNPPQVFGSISKLRRMR